MASFSRGLLLRTLAVFVGVCLVELVVRLVSIPFGGPRIFLYGTPWHRRVISVAPALERTTAYHLAEARGYTKYFPHEEKWARDTRGSYRVRINDHGLRGPDFETAKAPGVLRVLTLGASSTFGFENRDHETYPYYLQRRLDRLAGAGRFEVINFAVPHANSDEIVALFSAEGLALAPDVVTIYEGINDSKEAVFAESSGSLLRTLAAWSLTAFQLQQLVDLAFPRPPRMAQSVTGVADAIDEYLGNLAVLDDACRRIGARLIVITQQARSLMVEGPRLRGLTHAAEVRLVERQLSGEHVGALITGPVQAYTAPAFVAQAKVMEALRVWAHEHDVPLVDGIAALDARRDLVLTWVHLAPEGNKRLARALAETILEVTASDAHDAPTRHDRTEGLRHDGSARLP